MATSVPAPIAMPTSARASAGASLTPSPTIATPRPCRLELGDLGRLLAGKDLGDHLVDAHDSARDPRPSLVVAGEHHDLDPLALQRRHRGSRGGPDGVGDRQQRRPACPSIATMHDRLPSGSEVPRVRSSERRVHDPVRSISRALPTATLRPSTMAIAPCPGTFSNVATARSGRASAAPRGRWPRRAGARTLARPRRRGAARSSSSIPSSVMIVDDAPARPWSGFRSCP